MLELQWPYIHADRNGKPRHLGYVSGELFGAGGMKAVPENPRGRRSMSYEMRCKGKGEWNRYVVVAVDGTVKLSINGKFVNGIREADGRKGYLCLEAEGAEADGPGRGRGRFGKKAVCPRSQGISDGDPRGPS